MANSGPWNYILVFSGDLGTRDQVKDFLDSRAEVITWYYCMTHAIFIRSSLTAGGLTTMFREFTKDKGRFIIMDCATDRNGWLPKDAWAFMRSESQ
jgi:hypothetical protein